MLIKIAISATTILLHLLSILYAITVNLAYVKCMKQDHLSTTDGGQAGGVCMRWYVRAKSAPTETTLWQSNNILMKAIMTLKRITMGLLVEVVEVVVERYVFN